MRLGTIYLCCPMYGCPEPTAARQFWARACDPKGPNANVTRIQDDTGGSLLAFTFNKHWATALTLQAAGADITHFVMLHSDVAPCDWWLDILIEDLRKSGADLVAAALPIKDSRGLSTVAIDGTLTHFKVHRRLTMHELNGLPPVFDNKDCGYPDSLLLANTGCWICDFTKPWRLAENPDGSLKVCFEINDRVVKLLPKDNPDKQITTDVFLAENASEDWNFSRRVGALGGKVVCTRRVTATHWGKMPYRNDMVWGEVCDKGLLGEDAEPIKRAPGKEGGTINGWMQKEEMTALTQWASGKTVLEIGSYCGLSTVCLAQEALAVYAVDTFDGRGTAARRDTYQEFLANLDKFQVRDKVVIHRQTIEEAHSGLPANFDLVFIDAAHDFQSVLSHATLAVKKLAPRGLLAFHDYGSKIDPGVTAAVDGLLSMGSTLIEKVGSLALVKPGPALISVIKEPEKVLEQDLVGCPD